MKKIILLTSIILISAGCSSPAATPRPIANDISSSTPEIPATAPARLKPPIENALSRVTKKSFGIHVTPKNSPVQPERFSGYHTGVDFETTTQEKDTDITIFATCDGKLLLKKYATGYGGVAVQSCKLDGQDVTIIYGHLQLASINQKIGDTVKTGDKFGILGKGYSTETDGERKHLHFAIHKGTSTNILGYVQNKSLLSNWLNPEDYFK